MIYNMIPIWAKLFPKIQHAVRKISDRELYDAYHATDSISLKAVILYKLLVRRNKVFEEEIAKSVNYPHEVDWDCIGSEMFDLLAMSQKTLSDIVTTSKVMEEFIGEKYKEELKQLEER